MLQNKGIGSKGKFGEVYELSHGAIYMEKDEEGFLYPVVEVPKAAAGKKKATKTVDMAAKLFDEIAPKYADRKGGYTQIVKIGPRRGDAAEMAIIKLV